MTSLSGPLSLRRVAGGRTSRLAASLLVVAGLFVPACSTSRAGGEAVSAIETGDPDVVWMSLLERKASAASVISNSRIHIETPRENRTFRARIAADRSGKLRIDGITPIGTTAFQLAADDSHIVIVDSTGGSYWEGSAAQLGDALPVISELRISELSAAMFGLPGSEDRAGYELGPRGLSSFRSGSASVRYEPAAYPPVRVILESGDARVTIEHLEILHSSEPVKFPRTARLERLASPPVR